MYVHTYIHPHTSSTERNNINYGVFLRQQATWVSRFSLTQVLKFTILSGHNRRTFMQHGFREQMNRLLNFVTSLFRDCEPLALTPCDRYLTLA